MLYSKGVLLLENKFLFSCLNNFIICLTKTLWKTEAFREFTEFSFLFPLPHFYNQKRNNFPHK